MAILGIVTNLGIVTILGIVVLQRRLKTENTAAPSAAPWPVRR
jgi:hypothetical protein